MSRAPLRLLDQDRTTLFEELWDVVHLKDVLPTGPVEIHSVLYDELFASSRDLLTLAVRAVDEAGAGWAEQLAAFGATTQDYPLSWPDQALEAEFAVSMARPDIIVTPSGVRFLEFNISGAFGGPAETHLWTRAWQRIHPGLFFGHDPFAARSRFFERVCAERGAEKSLAVVATIEDLCDVETLRTFEVENDYLRQQGFTVTQLEPEQLAGLTADDLKAYPIGLRAFAVLDWYGNDISLQPVQRLIDQGWLLMPAQRGSLVANKKVLARLSDGTVRMTSSEQDFVHQVVPWTRVVGPGTTSWRGRHHDLAGLLSQCQQDLVLKKAISGTGKDVLIGRSATDRQWQQWVARAFATGEWIVQEVVDSAPYQLGISHDGGDTRTVDIEPVFSPMLIDGRPGGVWVRYFTDGRRGVVSVDGHGAQENVAMTRVPR